MKAPPSYLLAVILAVVDLAYTRRRLRSHVDAVNGPRIMEQARAWVLSTLAEAAALDDALPMTRAEVSKWATWIEGGIGSPKIGRASCRERV